jgi:hypothetical protein
MSEFLDPQAEDDEIEATIRVRTVWSVVQEVSPYIEAYYKGNFFEWWKFQTESNRKAVLSCRTVVQDLELSPSRLS